VHLLISSPTIPASPRREVFLRYLAYFRSPARDEAREMPGDQLTAYPPSG
jgi:hypothetical protein